jgi:hypothetical protein
VGNVLDKYLYFAEDYNCFAALEAGVPYFDYREVEAEAESRSRLRG